MFLRPRALCPLCAPQALTVKIYRNTNAIDPTKPASWPANPITLANGKYTSAGFDDYVLTGLTGTKPWNLLVVIENATGLDTLLLKYEGATDVLVSNTVAGDIANKRKDFDYTVFLMDAKGDPIGSGKSFSYVGSILSGSGATNPGNGTLTTGPDGQATFTLQHGQAITIKNLTIGSKIRIEQTPEDGYTITHTDSLSASTTVPGGNTTDKVLTAIAQRAFAFKNDTGNIVLTGLDSGTLSVMMALQLTAALISLALSALIMIEVKRKRLHAPQKQSQATN